MMMHNVNQHSFNIQYYMDRAAHFSAVNIDNIM